MLQEHTGRALIQVNELGENSISRLQFRIIASIYVIPIPSSL